MITDYLPIAGGCLLSFYLGFILASAMADAKAKARRERDRDRASYL